MPKVEALPLTAWQVAALRCLDHAVRRDAEKGGSGQRATRDVADYVGVNTDQARHLLYAVAELGLVECFDAKPLVWGITDAGREQIVAMGVPA